MVMYFKSLKRLSSIVSRPGTCIGLHLQQQCSSMKDTTTFVVGACSTTVPGRCLSLCHRRPVWNFRVVTPGTAYRNCGQFVNSPRWSLLSWRSVCELSVNSCWGRTVESVFAQNAFIRSKVVIQGQSLYSTSAPTNTEDAGPDFETMSKNVMETAKKRNVMAGSVPVTKVKMLLTDLHRQGFPMDRVVDVLPLQLQLLQDPEGVTSLTGLLLSHGLTQDTIISILENLPIEDSGITLKNIHKLILNSLAYLRSVGFTDKDIRFFITSEPRVLFLNSKTCNKILAKLKGLFTSADALFVIKSSPNVLSDSWKETNEKFDYAYFTMGYKQQEIIKSSLFQHSLEHIQDRHVFLVRAGLFYPVKEKDDPKTNPNPPLSLVVDTPDSAFVRKFGVTGLQEYKAYLNIREGEREELEEEEDMSDEGTDEESEVEEEQNFHRRGGKPKWEK